MTARLIAFAAGAASTVGAAVAFWLWETRGNR